MVSEKIYTLRRKSGLSQEQLAEKIGVSRQTVSKWENGAALPELEKLITLAQCFHVTLDELTGEGEPRGGQEAPEARPSKIGIALCVLGAVGLILFGVLALIAPSSLAAAAESSAVTLNGTGVLMAFFALCMAAGVVLILRKK